MNSSGSSLFAKIPVLGILVFKGFILYPTDLGSPDEILMRK